MTKQKQMTSCGKKYMYKNKEIIHFRHSVHTIRYLIYRKRKKYRNKENTIIIVNDT